MPGEFADDEETAVTEEYKLRIKVFNVIIDKFNQSLTNRFADHKNLYLDLSCFDPKRFSELKKGLPLNAFDKICDLYWPQISSSLTEEYTRDADIEYDSESETSEEIVQNELRTCRMEDPCKGCIHCAYYLKLIKTRLRSNMINYNLETFLIMQCERDKLVALDNDMVISKLCEQSEEMRRLLVL
ncbi:hypothetical protein PR048_003289 [Dryococelus australis]|uniref:Uncharacterized protein n=1 Tax=Dryococelus australis TaxID=614101 RepID=A0ABQ9IML5_9NEOP|nr:hypothetical protein PR048_003289 [Dryococelus australis]